MPLSFDAIQGIILAAGKSSRFGTGRTKVLESINGQAMLLYSVQLLKNLNIITTIVTGHETHRIQDHTLDYQVSYCLQTEQKGTGHALLCSQAHWHKEYILVLNADMPLIDANVVTALYTHHIEQQSALSFVVAHNTSNSTDYGRLVQYEAIERIVEARDFKYSLDDYPLVNAGIYLISHWFLSTAITHINDSNSAKEFYITDLIEQASRIKKLSYIQTSFECIQGVNTFEQLQAVENAQKHMIIKQHMNNGVRFDAPSTVRIEYNVSIAPGTQIGTGVQLTGNSLIGRNAFIGPYCIVNNSTIQHDARLVAHCVIANSTINAHAHIGPFSHIEGNSDIGSHSVIGSFVHINRSTIGCLVKAKHLAYLGDAQVGDGVNIGAGVVTANYDGVHKYKTTIHNNAFLGSNTTFIAPLEIGASSYIAAGSTINKTVEPLSLAIARSTQTNKINYAVNLKAKKRAASAAQLLLKKNNTSQSL